MACPRGGVPVPERYMHHPHSERAIADDGRDDGGDRCRGRRQVGNDLRVGGNQAAFTDGELVWDTVRSPRRRTLLFCRSAKMRRAENVGVGWRLEAPASGYRTPRDGCQLPGVKTLAGSCVTAPVWIRTSSIVMVARVVRFSTRRFADAAEGERFAPSSAPNPRVAAGIEPRAADVLSEIRSAKN
jgi:hypothetical protein